MLTIAGFAQKGKPGYEVWTWHDYNLLNNRYELKTVVLSSAGDCLYYMPEQGLLGVTKENSNQTGSWGRYTDKGNKLELLNEKYGKMDFYKVTPTQMSRYPDKKSSIYKKAKKVDGLKIEGAYTPDVSLYKNTRDITTPLSDPNRRPIIFFKKDGTYINEGLSFSNITFGDDFAIGKGTYEIKDFSLVLTTEKGRKLQVSFCGIASSDPATNPEGYVINGSLYYKLGTKFIPHD